MSPTSIRNGKIEVWVHALEQVERDFNKAWVLLSRLSERCHDSACDITGCDDLETASRGAADLLFELSHTLKFMVESLEGSEGFVAGIRGEELARAKRRLTRVVRAVASGG